MAKSSGGVRCSRRRGSSSPQAIITEAQRFIKAQILSIQPNRELPKTPFKIGNVEKVMIDFCRKNNIELAGQDLMMSPFQIQHALRDSKAKDGKTVSHQDLIDFPIKYKKMELYFEKKDRGFIYVDRSNNTKFYVNPNKKIKKNGKHVIIVTGSKFDSKTNFDDPNEFIRIK
ncbi:MAG: hypothetical protein LUD17_14775 [Bacteroidales bacterium]|nr:hypothetical protein [Bacteroidales bacterium]